MKFNFEKKPGVNTTNKKEVAKFEAEKKRRQIAVATNADYLARQKENQSAFGKDFKTGPQASKKEYSRKNKDY